ncbi:MAG TPA: NADH-quinone oxidoreductase subunit NuoH [Rectinemataceae bacterium]|nr:NADH-quinone oxidoreductase subunit NuoH [Rectinemataceae bacterium]
MGTLNDLFLTLASAIRGLLALWGFPPLLAAAVVDIADFVLVAALVTVNIIVIVWLDRRVAAFFQERLGPNRVGPFGLLQSVNDAVKLLGKESIIPVAADRKLYKAAPLMIFTVTVLLYGFLPYGKGMAPVDPDLSLLFFIALSSMTTIAILMAGWGSNSKYSLLGGMRTVAQVISYEIPMAFSMLGVVMLSGSLNLGAITEAQRGVWYIFLQPLAFVIFLISSLAELARSPFDMTEAEQELVAGYHTEYTGMRFALFFMAEYGNLFGVAALGATLFLGGWQGPFLPGYVWFLGKSWLLVLVILWLRWTFPRARLDQMMKFNWKFLIPLSILNILLTGVGIKLYQYFAAVGR